MNVIKQIRSQTGLSQQQLADAAGTSQPTIAAYESGRKSPTIKTLERIATASGLQANIIFTPPMSREDRRSLAFHQAIAILLREGDPSLIVNKAGNNIQKLQDLHPHANRLFSRWKQWLNLPVDTLTHTILDPGLEAREMRQVSPFSGVLTTKERTQILKQFRAEEGE